MSTVNDAPVGSSGRTSSRRPGRAFFHSPCMLMDRLRALKHRRPDVGASLAPPRIGTKKESSAKLVGLTYASCSSGRALTSIGRTHGKHPVGWLAVTTLTEG